jgi:hypothetical protein
MRCAIGVLGAAAVVFVAASFARAEPLGSASFGAPFRAAFPADLGEGSTPGGDASGGAQALGTGPPLVGDANSDGVVDLYDLSVVLTNLGKSGMTWAQGDFDGSGTVDNSDLQSLLPNYDQTSSGVVVPEPCSLALFVMGALAWSLRRRSQ